MTNPCKILAIGGSDPSGGAGIQCDIKTIVKLGGYPASVITAITAQNSQGVDGIWGVEPDHISSQIKAVLNDFMPDAVKIGLIVSRKSIECVAEAISSYNLRNVVLDPVLSPSLSSIQPDMKMLETMATLLFPLCTIITPNFPEKELFEKATGKTFDDLCEAYLLKGGHDSGKECIDRLFFKISVNQSDKIPSSAFPSINFNHSSLFDTDNLLPDPEETIQTAMREFRHRRLQTRNTHGTGCMLSSALAFALAKGEDLPDAVRSASDFVNVALKKSVNINIGKGDYGPALI